MSNQSRPYVAYDYLDNKYYFGTNANLQNYCIKHLDKFRDDRNFIDCYRPVDDQIKKLLDIYRTADKSKYEIMTHISDTIHTDIITFDSVMALFTGKVKPEIVVEVFQELSQLPKSR